MCFSHTTLFSCAESVHFHDLVRTILGFVSILSDWVNINYLVAYENKTKLLLSTSRIHPVLPDIVLIKIHLIGWRMLIKYPGINIDNKLSFNFHITDVCRRLSKIRRVIICSVPVFLDREFLLTLYYSLVYSHINHGVKINLGLCFWK